MIDWIKIDPENLPEPQRMLACNGVKSWTVDMIHKGKEIEHEKAYAFLDCGRQAWGLTHYAVIGEIPE